MRLFAAIWIVLATAYAQVPEARSVAPPPVPRPRVTDLSVKATMDGNVARVQQVLTVKNPGNAVAEFDLVFPLDPNAVISGLDLRVGDRTIEGRVYSQQEAQELYRRLTRQTRDPALLEHYGYGAFRARVFPIAAGESQVLTLSYELVVRPEGDANRLTIPLTAFRRGDDALNLSIEGEVVAGHPITTLYSPTHDLGKIVVSEAGSADAPRFSSKFTMIPRSGPNEADFVLYYKARPAGTLVDVSVLSERPNPGEAGYFLAILNGVPGKTVEPEPRDVVFVIDRSGSMQGKKIEQAKGALKFLVERLRPEDRFNIVTYAANVETFQDQLGHSSADALGGTLKYIDAIEATGGTNIEGALSTALGQFSGSERTNQIVFLTDGLPTVGERNDAKISAAAKKANTQGVRIVAFGVGHDVNAAFLDRLAVQNRGLSEYVLPSENLEDKVPGFYSRMQSPLLLDATLKFGGVSVMDVYPAELGDIYGGHQVLVTGRYVEPGAGTVHIKGRRGQEAMEFAFPATFAPGIGPGSSQLVARVWAAKKIGYLVDEIRLNGQSKELVDEIVRLGTRFGILTEYTSFLAAPETDLSARDANRDKAGAEVRDRAGEVAGAHGVAQAANSKDLQRGSQARARNAWLGDDGKMVEIHGVQNLGGKAFFKRGSTWLDSGVAEAAREGATEVPYFSDEFFDLLAQHPWLNQCVARTGDVTVSVDGKVVRFLQSQ